MGIEENIERIANALERIASAQEENTKINASYKAFLTEREARHVMENGGVQDDPLANGAVILPDGAVTPKTEVPAPAPAPAPVMAAPSGQVITQEMIEASAYVTAHPTALTALGKDLAYDELKVELLARAHAYKKGTKLTTLQKEWDLHKHEPIIGQRPASPSDVNPAGYAPSLTEAPAPAPAPTPAPAPAQDPFGTDDAPARLTKKDTIARIMETYQKPADKPAADKAFDQDCVVAALKKAGVNSFKEIEEEDFDKLEIVLREYERLKGLANA